MRLEIVMKNVIASAIAAFALGLPALAAADEILDKTIVFIECSTGNGQTTSRGSGVLVSPKGHVLTAKHVVSQGSGIVCKGSIGNAFAPTSQMIIGKKSNDYDAQLLQFSGVQSSPHLKYCKLEDPMRREIVYATGFPGKTATGVPSSRLGVLATVQPGPDGLIETDSETTRGMSGGMVTLAGSAGLIGIISGAKVDPGTGLPEYYGVLPAEMISTELGLIEESLPCSRAARLASQTEVKWSAKDGRRELGMRQDEGYCFLTGVWGVFNDASDI